jgi:hypothetical protein
MSTFTVPQIRMSFGLRQLQAWFFDAPQAQRVS